ncbi:GLPGLI family protein [Mucilaginibacter sp. RS28]|uniref:GLPGLI family protein n=1 Tax=Mucilaginibacter straminoryzae TaxID=2932774 RepID=A0A9X2B8S0_9SPHI|nr:GLPGLI family protein [Mucilaginibacter straminoryzae]MCJ8209701.1 GLPGLI family protein [Mucilaginibacter straminoryzae]
MFKQIFCALLVLFTSNALQAQDKTSGVIYYKQVSQLRIKAAPGQSATATNGSGFTMPDKMTTEFELVFNANGARYQKYDGGDVSNGLPGGVRIMSMGSNRKVYYNFSENKILEYIPLDGENYLMESKLGSAADTVEKTDQTKTIIGFNCKKAIIKNKTGVTELWYTNDLKFNASPLLPYWTEGVVLAVNNNRNTVEATSIEYYKVKDKELALPKDAKPITAEAYKAKQEELMKKMQQSGGSSFRFGN